MTLTPEQIAAIVPVVVGLLLALTQYLQRQATKTENATTHAQLSALHRAVTAPPSVGANASPNNYVAPLQGLVDGHALPPRQ